MHYDWKEDYDLTDDSLAEFWVSGHKGNHGTDVQNLETFERPITECVGLGENDICITRTTPDIREDNILGQGSHVQVYNCVYNM